VVGSKGILRQRGLEPLTYCLEGAISSLSRTIDSYHKRLTEKEIGLTKRRWFYQGLSAFIHQY
jgi:hypothetical protein